MDLILFYIYSANYYLYNAYLCTIIINLCCSVLYVRRTHTPKTGQFDREIRTPETLPGWVYIFKLFSFYILGIVHLLNIQLIFTPTFIETIIGNLPKPGCFLDLFPLFYHATLKIICSFHIHNIPIWEGFL